MDSAACLLLLLVAGMGHCENAPLTYYRDTVFLAQAVSQSFGDEMVMEIIDHDVADGILMTLTEALNRLLCTPEMDKYVADVIDQLKGGFMCKVLRYTALTSKLGMRSIDSAKISYGDTHEFIVAYTKVMGMTVANMVSNLVSQFYETKAADTAADMESKLKAIDEAQGIEPSSVIKEGAIGSIRSSVTAAAEQAAAGISNRIKDLLTREDGDLAAAMKEFAELKGANVDTYNAKFDELVGLIVAKAGGETDESVLHGFTAEQMPELMTEIAMKVAGNMYGEVAESCLQQVRATLDSPSAYLTAEGQEQIKVFLDELDATIPKAAADPDAAHAMLAKLFEWSTGKIATECSLANNNDTLYATLVGGDIVGDAFSDSQLTAKWLLDKQVAVVEKLKAEQESLPAMWKAAA